MEKDAIKKLGAVVLILILVLLIVNLLSVNEEVTTQAVQSNKDFVAPSVSINFPNNYFETQSPNVNVKGNAQDNVQIKEVRVKLNNGKWEKIAKSIWSKDFILIHGENTVYAQAFDVSENPSPISSIKIIYGNNKPTKTIRSYQI